MNNEKIITRFAPSPTGEPHIGNFRTALFEYLAAKSTGGKFYLRIEDTDRSRYVEGSIEKIIDALKWMNLVPDNLDDIVYQTKRIGIYKSYALQLLKEGKAYICTCTRERLDGDRKRQESEKKPTGYEGHCREAGIKIEDVKEGEYVIRMKMPKSGKVIVHDLIRGDIEFDLSLSDDQVIIKSDGFPTYHLAAIVDDHEMEITHVIRGEEWLSSTPKHLTLYQMFGWQAPEFAHLSMILASDKTKLSKRHGATGISEYKKLGYLPEAVVNFLVLMGWNTGDNREFFALAELEKEFNIEEVNKAPAIFNVEKLNSINTAYLMKLEPKRLKNELKGFGLENLSEGEITLLLRGGYATLKEMAEYIAVLRVETDYKAELLIFKKSDKKNTTTALRVVAEKLKAEEEWDANNVQKVLEYTVIENGLTNGDVFWPVRVALSGADRSPSPVELLSALGKDESLKRLEKAIKKLV
jgi:glutamyl-tRNA synthetase